MAIGPRLDLRQSQQLVITPQLQAAIKLLTLSNLELEAQIDAELESNPLLERADPDEGQTRTADEAGDSFDDAPVIDIADGLADGAAAAEATDADLVEERFHHDAAPDRPAGDGGEAPDLDAFACADGGLHGLLLQQARAALDGGDLVIAEHLIDAIDDAGYLREDVAAIAERLDATPERVERVLSAIQRFEPTGVGARDLVECLTIQARDADRYDPCMAMLIDNLDLLARGELATLRRLCGVDAEDFADMLRELRGYHPKPGLTVGGTRVDSVSPDILVRRGRGGWTVELNSATLPRLVVNRQYQRQVASGGKAARTFADEAAGRAQWLVRTLDQRASTILRVGTELVRQQAGFFERGVEGLRPLTLRAIADALGLHESTVSRATANKYLHCERGLFELKYFFTNAIPQDGADASSEAVRQRIRALIEAEPALKPLSDDKIVELLRAQGLDLARRTVTKYREAMHIPSSFDRRRRALVAAA